MDRNNWQLYEEDGYWHWNVWDVNKKEWWISEGFEKLNDACAARDKMMSDTGA